MRSRHIQRMKMKRYGSTVLLGPDGEPASPPGGEVPFICWQPDGTSVGRSIDRGREVYAQAAKFMAKGGRYAYVIRLGGEAELVAGFPLDDGARGEMALVAEEIVQDGPEIGPAIDRLVAASVANMDRFTVVTEAA